MKGKLISISIRYADFSNIVRSTTIDYYTNDEKVILETALLLFDKNNTKQMPIRHLGVGLASLYSNTKQITQLKLFHEDDSTLNVLDELNKYVKGSKLIYASQMKKNVDK